MSRLYILFAVGMGSTCLTGGRNNNTKGWQKLNDPSNVLDRASPKATELPSRNSSHIVEDSCDIRQETHDDTSSHTHTELQWESSLPNDKVKLIQR